MLTANAVPLVPALVGIGGLAAIAILRRFAPKPAGEASLPVKKEPTDLLAEAETEAETAAIAAALAAKAERAEERPSEEPPTEEDAEPLAWDECEETYAPIPIEAGAFLHSLGLEKIPETPPKRSQVFIRRRAYERVRTHLAGDLDVEQGGLLIGQALYDPQLAAYFLVIEEALLAQEGIETPTSFSYTPASWASLTPHLQALDPNWTVLGSYHSHPGMGVFLSQTDRDTQAGIFSQAWQLALVVDPVADEVGFFVGESEKPCMEWHIIADRS